MAKTPNHSKFKNTGLLFELLTKQITNDLINEKNSKAEYILKKYFKNTELLKEFKLYNYLISNKSCDKDKANEVLSTVLEVYAKLDKNKLNKEKYNLIKEIKNNFNISDFLKNKIDYYRDFALINNLFEYNDDINIHQKIKQNVLEMLQTTNKQVVSGEFTNSDKDVKLLTYRLLVNKFNEKYKTLTESQRNILKQYISISDSNTSLVTFYNKNICEIKDIINNFINNCNDTVLKIKLTEVNKNILEHNVKTKFDESNLVNLMYYCELIDEIKVIHEHEQVVN